MVWTMTGLKMLKGTCMILSLKASSFLVVGLAGYGNSVLGNSLDPVKNHMFRILNRTPRHFLTTKRLYAGTILLKNEGLCLN
uniref:PIR121 n=1 Tax=Arundo donax TaxID=35708 RepID=A0A0A9D490_ARUDO